MSKNAAAEGDMSLSFSNSDGDAITLSLFLNNTRDLSSERALHRGKATTFRKHLSDRK
jgi:hypothetical protein